ncbi:MAG: isocitrate lyase/phosphoenolpyruvate mutase family protein [Propionibacteriales bacterium]|nr:isocitrate lyase/phosphoenolpyruvate mutase family protein [Propionibacteriales bacterium]
MRRFLMVNMSSDDQALSRADSKRAKLREGLAAGPVVAVGAHDAMSARLIEGHGFDAVWVSGFGVSAMAYGLPDLNLITMTETLAVTQRIVSVTELPVVVDCDNGYGGFSNVVRTIVEFDRAGVAAVCIEDNLFPKRNSLYQGQSKRELIDPQEQARRLRAAKSAQESPSFVLIARVEALIAGHGVDAACERAVAYAEAGADAILIHSKDKSLVEIESFLEQWHKTGISKPLVAVPTLFPDYTAKQLHAKGFSMVILANQPMRASVQAMEDTLRTLRAEGKPAAADPHIAKVDHIFDLVHTRETIEAEEADEPA